MKPVMYRGQAAIARGNSLCLKHLVGGYAFTGVADGRAYADRAFAQTFIQRCRYFIHLLAVAGCNRPAIDAVLGCLLRGGFSLELTAHAYATIDSFVYGFALEEANLPAQGADGFGEVAEEMSAMFDPDAYPHLVAFTVEHVLQPGYDFSDSFDFGLDLILDGFERAAG